MTKSNLQLNEIISLTLMLLMFVALVAGQTQSTAFAAENARDVDAAAILQDSLNIDLNGRLGDAAVQVSIDIITELSHFRGEDE